MNITKPHKPIAIAEVLDYVASPAFDNYRSDAAKKLAAKRISINAHIVEGDAETAKKMAELIAKGHASFARHQKLIEALKAEAAHLNAITAERIGTSGAWDNKRGLLERELTETASPLIDEFLAWIADDEVMTFKADPREDTFFQVNVLTGKRTAVAQEYSRVSPTERAEALRLARTAALEMKLLPDQSGVAAAIAKIKNALPIIAARKE